MKTLYKFKVAAFGKAIGDTIEMDSEDPNVKGLLANGTIEEDASAADGLIAKAIESLTAGLSASYEAMAAKTIETVTAGIKAKGPAIEAGKSQVERQKSLGHQCVQIGLLGNPDTPAHVKEKAARIMVELYGSRFEQWDAKADRFDYSATVQKASGTMVENSGPSGGYGVYPEFSANIYKIAIEETILASKARKMPMTSNELRYPKLDQTGTQATGQTGYLGGVVAGWANETKTGNQTQAKLKQGVLKAGELVGYTVVTNELLADNGIGLEALLSQLFVEAIAYYTDLACLVGDGVDKPTGVSIASATLGQARTTSNHFVYADAVSMRSKLLSKSEETAFWVFNKTVQPELYNMVDGASRNIWLPNHPGADLGPVATTGAKTFLDLPYFFTEKTPVLGTKGDALLIDPQGYMIGDRMSLEIAASPHVNFLNREMTYRFVARIAGQPLLDKPFTMIDGTNQLSTFVALNA